MLNLTRIVPLHPLLRNTLRSISIPSLSNKSASFPRDHQELADIIEDQAKHHKPYIKPPFQSKSFFSRDRSILWKPFRETTHIRPHQLTYKSRLKSRPPPFKRQTVGPGSSEARYNDVFHQLGLDPLAECQNPDLLAGFMSEMGKIDGREKTGLTTRNQRRLAKAIRRAKQLGVIPLLSRPNIENWRSRRNHIR